MCVMAYLEVVLGKDGNVAEVDVLGGALELLERKVGPDEVSPAGVDATSVHVASGASARESVLECVNNE